MDKKKNKTFKILLFSTLSILIVGGILFATSNQKQFNNVNFSKLNNSSFGNKGKYDYMKKSKSFQPSDKKKHTPSALKWKY